jgi:hypothetical protein
MVGVQVVMKHPRPQDARKALKRMWSSVAVYSCIDGTLRIEPTWKERSGVFTRAHSAYLVECLMRLPRKRTK